MSIVMDLGAGILFLGTLVCMIGGIGLIRLPNFFARTHGGSVTDTLGALLALSGMSIYTLGMDMSGKDQALVIVKLLSIGIFLLVTSPISGHALTRAAYKRGLRGEKTPDLDSLSTVGGGVFGAAERREILEDGTLLADAEQGGDE